MGISEVLANKSKWTVAQGDCRVLLRSMPAESVAICVTSPPY